MSTVADMAAEQPRHRQLPEPLYDELRIFCPFSDSGDCAGGCPSRHERACVNGEPGEDG